MDAVRVQDTEATEVTDSPVVETVVGPMDDYPDLYTEGPRPQAPIEDMEEPDFSIPGPPPEEESQATREFNEMLDEYEPTPPRTSLFAETLVDAPNAEPVEDMLDRVAPIVAAELEEDEPVEEDLDRVGAMLQADIDNEYNPFQERIDSAVRDYLRASGLSYGDRLSTFTCGSIRERCERFGIPDNNVSLYFTWYDGQHPIRF